MEPSGQEVPAFLKAGFEHLVLGDAGTEAGKAVQSAPVNLHVKKVQD